MKIQEITGLVDWLTIKNASVVSIAACMFLSSKYYFGPSMSADVKVIILMLCFALSYLFVSGIIWLKGWWQAERDKMDVLHAALRLPYEELRTLAFDVDDFGGNEFCCSKLGPQKTDAALSRGFLKRRLTGHVVEGGVPKYNVWFDEILVQEKDQLFDELETRLQDGTFSI